MVITFDFDDTLLWTAVDRDEDGSYVEHNPIGQNPYVFPRLLEALDSGAEVHIVTSRRSETEGEVMDWLDVWKKHNPQLSRLAGVHFTEGQLKHDTLARLGSQLHFDDDPEELAHLPEGCRGVRAPLHPSWSGQLGEGRYLASSRSDEMRRLRLVGQNERLLREAVRGMLEGIADAGPDEARREREEIIAKLPQSDATDTVFASLGFATDVIGVGLNRFEAAWWGKPFNLLADSFSAMWASMQLSRAAKRNLDVVMTDLSHLDDKTRKRILFIYNFDHQISRIAMAISIAGVAASVAQVKGVQLAGAAEVGLKALKWTLFGLSLSDAAVGNAQALLEIGRRINDIKEWANRFDVGAAIRAIEMYKGFLATKEGKEATVTATAGLTNSAGANVDAVTSSILEVIPPHQLDEMLDFIRGIKQEASAIA